MNDFPPSPAALEVYHESAYYRLGLLIVSQARCDAENGDDLALDWLLTTGCDWLSTLGAEDKQIANLSREVTKNAFKAKQAHESGLQATKSDRRRW